MYWFFFIFFPQWINGWKYHWGVTLWSLCVSGVLTWLHLVLDKNTIQVWGAGFSPGAVPASILTQGVGKFVLKLLQDYKSTYPTACKESKTIAYVGSTWQGLRGDAVWPPWEWSAGTLPSSSGSTQGKDPVYHQQWEGMIQSTSQKMEVMGIQLMLVQHTP